MGNRAKRDAPEPWVGPPKFIMLDYGDTLYYMGSTMFAPNWYMIYEHTPRAVMSERIPIPMDAPADWAKMGIGDE